MEMKSIPEEWKIGIIVTVNMGKDNKNERAICSLSVARKGTRYSINGKHIQTDIDENRKGTGKIQGGIDVYG